MAVNVTYLLGAGASFEALPLVKEVKISETKTKPSFAQEILNLADQYRRLPGNLPVACDKPEIERLVASLESFGNQCMRFSSPDTLVRSLWLQKNKEHEIERIKKLLSFYLTVSQLLGSKLDSRYVPFLASILENQKTVCIPDNINVLSWNYDFQLELGLQRFFPQMNLTQIQSHFSSIPGNHNKNEHPKIVHLNGISGVMKDSDRSTSFFEREYNGDNLYRLNEFLEIYKALNSSYEIGDYLSFAWEIEAAPRIVKARQVMSKTEILVVIGYSFPFFNRKIDRLLFKELFSENEEINIDPKIYIQDPRIDNDQINFLRQSFEISDEIEIEPLRDVTQFFLPPEL